MDPYVVLGIRQDATSEEIKTAFRKKAFLFHPDMHSKSSPEARRQAATKFREISNAYEILSDAKSRAAYNRNKDMGRYANPYNSYEYKNQQRYGQNSSSYTGGQTKNQWSNDPFDEWARYRQSRARYQNTMKWRDFSSRFGRYLAIQTFFSSLILILVVSIGKSTDAAWEYNNRGKRFEDILNSRFDKSDRNG